MRSISATEVPPNFITSRPIAGLGAPWVDVRRVDDPRMSRRPARPAEKARIHNGEGSGPQPPSSGICSGARELTEQHTMVSQSHARAPTVDEAELARFAALADEWWNPRGKMAPLHKFNPVRLGYVRDAACRHFTRDAKRLDCLKGLRVLDIGCGGGILSEPLARLGAEVVGADPAEPNIAAARLHATDSGIAVDYRATTAEALAEAGERFDVVLAMEVVEHVADVNLFVALTGAMVRPGGLMIAATINRTLKSFALAIVGAEYILRWLPRGTHQWDKFVTPNELEIALELAGLRVVDEAGVIYNPLADHWRLARDTDVNYMLTAERPA
jgi:2-polyprenyl-6-hydroxyphenyl methylase/3-demethylubiquinone-9 3-methyltransferase